MKKRPNLHQLNRGPFQCPLPPKAETETIQVGLLASGSSRPPLAFPNRQPARIQKPYGSNEPVTTTWKRPRPSRQTGCPAIQACPLRRKDGPRSQWRGPRRNRKESPLTDQRASKEAPYLHRLPSFGLPVLLRETPETTARIIGAHGCLSRAQSGSVAAKQRSFEKNGFSGRR